MLNNIISYHMTTFVGDCDLHDAWIGMLSREKN